MFYNKYIKYKRKYTNLVNQNMHGGARLSVNIPILDEPTDNLYNRLNTKNVKSITSKYSTALGTYNSNKTKINNLINKITPNDNEIYDKKIGTNKNIMKYMESFNTMHEKLNAINITFKNTYKDMYNKNTPVVALTNAPIIIDLNDFNKKINEINRIMQLIINELIKIIKSSYGNFIHRFLKMFPMPDGANEMYPRININKPCYDEKRYKMDKLTNVLDSFKKTFDVNNDELKWSLMKGLWGKRKNKDKDINPITTNKVPNYDVMDPEYITFLNSLSQNEVKNRMIVFMFYFRTRFINFILANSIFPSDVGQTEYTNCFHKKQIDDFKCKDFMSCHVQMPGSNDYTSDYDLSLHVHKPYTMCVNFNYFMHYVFQDESSNVFDTNLYPVNHMFYSKKEHIVSKLLVNQTITVDNKQNEEFEYRIYKPNPDEDHRQLVWALLCLYKNITHGLSEQKKPQNKKIIGNILHTLGLRVFNDLIFTKYNTLEQANVPFHAPTKRPLFEHIQPTDVGQPHFLKIVEQYETKFVDNKFVKPTDVPTDIISKINYYTDESVVTFGAFSVVVGQQLGILEQLINKNTLTKSNLVNSIIENFSFLCEVYFKYDNTKDFIANGIKYMSRINISMYYINNDKPDDLNNMIESYAQIKKTLKIGSELGDLQKIVDQICTQFNFKWDKPYNDNNYIKHLKSYVNSDTPYKYGSIKSNIQTNLFPEDGNE